MGIKPEGTNPVIVPPDNVQTRWGEWEASIDTAGQQAGEVFAETHAIATSANTIAADAIERAQGYITAAENVTAELTAEIDPEHPDYLLWSLANQVDQATHQALRAHSDAISANDIAIQSLTRAAALMATVRHGEAYAGEHFVASWNNSVVTIAKRGSWIGDVTVMVGAETYVWLPTDSSMSYTVATGSNVTILYQVKPGTLKSKSIDSPKRRTLANGAWETLAQWVVPSDTQVSASGSFVWANKTFLGDYYARLTLDGVPVTTGEVSSGAPLFGHGARTHQVSMRLRSASRNAVLRLEARASHGNSLNRQVRDASLTTQWVGQVNEAVEIVKIVNDPNRDAWNQLADALSARGLNYSTVTEIPFTVDVSAATDLDYMFYEYRSLVAAPVLVTGSAVSMRGMFMGCSSLTSVPDLATASVTDVSSMFYSCASLTDGSVKLIGKNPNVVTSNMITGSGLTVKPFYDSEGNPIPDDEEKDYLSVSVNTYYSSPNNLWSPGSQSGDTGIIASLSESFIRFNVAVTCNRAVLINTRSYPAGTVFAAGEYLRPSDWGVVFTFTTV